MNFISNKTTLSSFLLIDANNANAIIFDKNPLLVLDKNQDSKIVEACGGVPDVDAVPEGFTGLLDYVLGPVIDFFVDQVNKKVKKELEEYSSIYASNKNFDLYSNTNSGSTDFPKSPTLKWTCFRVTFKEKIDNKEEITFDLISQLKTVLISKNHQLKFSYRTRIGVNCK